ncbi:MAG: 50S ribosomal protein L10, partial [Candidatus ainarchaeum sp.]|nr:50S ribosomal protein L10 [Candidatus ainarchaeum sp.]
MTKHIKQWRIDQFSQINKLISDYKVIGIGDLENFPSALLHKLRKKLPDVKFKVTNRNVLKRVLDSLNHKDILEILPKQPIIILTNDNAFELYANIKKNKARSKAKVGMVSPIDIIIPEGDTGLAPGPALSDLKKVGLKAQVKGPTIYITKDAVVTSKGEIISSDVVSTLSKLDIKPIELILEISGVKEDGLIYNKDILN